MKIGVPKGLLYNEYRFFVETFFRGLGAEIVNSPNTNREILDLGVEYCVDEACLPMKVFHGHVCWLRDRCDAIFVPRIMSMREREYICPKFCGLTEMLANSIPGLPELIGEPIYWTGRDGMFKWAKKAGTILARDRSSIKKAFDAAIREHEHARKAPDRREHGINAALLGHPYNIDDAFINMDLKNKLDRMGVGIVTQESVKEEKIEEEVSRLFKKPFWTFARNTYGAAVNLCMSGKIDGIIYVSSFACGIDSVVIDLIRLETVGYGSGPAGTGSIPLLVLKLDEHTGEAGVDTRIEAFVDLLVRRKKRGRDYTSHGKRLSGGQSTF